MGPLDELYYEGRHTTDTRNAYLRADSTIHDDKPVSWAARGCHGRKRKRRVSVSSGDLSASIKKRDKDKTNAKATVEASPSSARKPASKLSSPKPLSKSGTFISSVTLVHSRIRPIPKFNLHQSLPTVNAVSQSGSDAQVRELDIPVHRGVF
ncbi:hypothetical protein BDR07DRAFT_1502519 [Suillus spraguei]|nr:hypothetical protein BDR07DRAFT_1502519 [Suillus spraguei]